MCSTQFLNVANISSVNIALPDIAADLGFSAATLPWVVSAYPLTFAGFLLVSGRVADLVGRRKVLLAGFAVFAAATVVESLHGIVDLRITKPELPWPDPDALVGAALTAVRTAASGATR